VEHHWSCYNEWYNKYLSILKDFIIDKEIQVIVDLGANTGSIAQLLCREIAWTCGKWPEKLVAIEPFLPNIPFLLQTLEGLRDFASSQVVHQHTDVAPRNMATLICPSACFYSDKKTTSMSAQDNNRGGFFVSDIKDIKSKETKDVVGSNIPILSLEEILERCNVTNVDLLKIDIEGSEWNVIKNSTAIKERVQNIVIEVHDKTIDEAKQFFALHLPMFEIFAMESEQFFLQRIAGL